VQIAQKTPRARPNPVNFCTDCTKKVLQKYDLQNANVKRRIILVKGTCRCFGSWVVPVKTTTTQAVTLKTE